MRFKWRHSSWVTQYKIRDWSPDLTWPRCRQALYCLRWAYEEENNEQDACRDGEKHVQFFTHNIIRASYICRHLLRALYFKKRNNHPPQPLYTSPEVSIVYIYRYIYLYLFHLPAWPHFITNPSNIFKLLKRVTERNVRCHCKTCYFLSSTAFSWLDSSVITI